MADIYTDVGETLTTDLMDGTIAVPTWTIAWGTGAGTAAKGDTTLFTEASESRQNAALSQPSANVNQFLATITADGTKTITNAGVFDAASVGNMLLKSDFGGVALTSGDKIEFTFQLTWSSSSLGAKGVHLMPKEDTRRTPFQKAQDALSGKTTRKKTDAGEKAATKKSEKPKPAGTGGGAWGV